MRFPVTFTRRKVVAGPSPLVGSDAAPTTTAPSAKADNILFCGLRDCNGWPVQRIAICWSSPDAVTPTPFNVDAYFWETATGHWYKINDAALSVKPNQLFFFDTVTISAPTATNSTINQAGSPSQPGGMEIFIVVSDPGAQVNGTYNFAVGGDLTTVGT
jgi:hypothetical protein